MIRRIGRKRYNVFTLDIESHNDEESIANRETSMWLGCFINELSSRDDEESYFYNWDMLFNKLDNLTNQKRNWRKDKARPITNVLIFVHNLSFEYSFILPYLLENGYQWKQEIEKTDSYCFNSITNKSCSSVWSITIKMKKSAGIITFRDSAKLFPMTLRSLAFNFGLKTQKGEIDYRLNRLHNYKITQEEKYYCFDDCKIIMDILEIMDKKDDKLWWKSFSVASYATATMIKEGYPRAFKPMKAYRKEYPNLDAKENEFLRNSYHGGLCYAVSDYQFKDIANVLHIDAHSMYPSRAFLHYYPYGKGTYFTGKPNDNHKTIKCIHCKISYAGVKLHSQVELIGLDFISDYEITLWDFELRLMYKLYNNLKVKFIDGYEYNKKLLTFRNFFKNHFDARVRAKNAAKEYKINTLGLKPNTKEYDNAFTPYDFDIMINKLYINSSYGKLAERPHNEIYQNVINDMDIIDSLVINKTGDDIAIESKYTYLPVGACITAYARYYLIETALKFGVENCLYFDTDSIFALYNDKTRKVWDTEINRVNDLGGWGLEEISDKAYFACAKRYKLDVKTDTGNKTIVKAGGINFEDYRKTEILFYDNINLDNNTFKVKRAFRVKGGTIIDYQLKKISVAEKFMDTYNDNKNSKYDLHQQAINI